MDYYGTYIAEKVTNILKTTVGIQSLMKFNPILMNTKMCIMTIFATVLCLSTSALALGGDGSGGGFSCKTNSKQRVLLDLIENNPHYQDDYKSYGSTEIVLPETWKTMGFSIINMNSFAQLKYTFAQLEKIIQNIGKSVSPQTREILTNSYRQLFYTFRLTKSNVYSLEDYVLSNPQNCSHLTPIGFYTFSKGLTINVNVLNQMGFKSRVGFFLHETLRFVQFKLKGTVNLTTKDIQDLVYDAIEGRFHNLNSKWKDHTIFTYLKDEKILTAKAALAAYDICHANSELVEKAKLWKATSNESCNRAMQEYIHAIQDFTNLSSSSMCLNDNYKNQKMNSDSKSEISVFPLDEVLFLGSENSEKINNIYEAQYAINDLFIKLCPFDQEDLEKTKTHFNGSWNFFNRYMTDYEVARKEMVLKNGDIFSKTSLSDLHLKGDAIIFLGVERVLSLMLTVEKDESRTRLRQEFNVSQEKEDAFMNTIKRDIGNSKQVYPSADAVHMARELIKESLRSNNPSEEEMEAKAMELSSFTTHLRFMFP